MKHYIIESTDQVDTVHTDEQLAKRTDQGWNLVADMTGQEWPEVLAFAHQHAAQSGKRCRLPDLAKYEQSRKALGGAFRSMMKDMLTRKQEEKGSAAPGDEGQ